MFFEGTAAAMVPLNDEYVGMLYRNHIKNPNKKENWPESFPRDYLWILGKGVLY